MTVADGRHDSLNGRCALVTGGASGIGRATAQALLERGCRVSVLDREPPTEPLSSKIRLLEADLRQQAAVDQAFAELQQAGALPDILVSAAGRGVHERLTEGDPAKWADVLESNLLGALRLVRAFVPPMLEDGGDVLFVSSVAATHAYPWGGPYAASKAGLEMIAETLRLEVQPKVRVGSIAPGVVDTAFFDRMGAPGVEQIGFGSISPEQVAELICHALAQPPELAVNHLTVRPRAQPF